jgi:hypothetical protein
MSRRPDRTPVQDVPAGPQRRQEPKRSGPNGLGRRRIAKEGIDDWHKAASDAAACAQRSISFLDALIAGNGTCRMDN